MIEYAIEKYVEERSPFRASFLLKKLGELHGADYTAAIELLDELTGHERGNSLAIVMDAAGCGHPMIW